MVARIARNLILYNGCYAHVISQSIRNIKIFKDQEDFVNFYNFLKLAKRRSGFKLYHYCLMHTHFHLAVMVPNFVKFAKAIQFIKSQYSRKYHVRYRTNGPIWRERYRSLLIEDENYLRDCGRYIEDNPLKAGLVERAEDWEFSSGRYYENNVEDDLVNGYEELAKSQKSVELYLDKDKEEFFENGKVIGSAFFRFQFMEKLIRN